MIPVKINVDEGVIMQKINFYTGMAATCVAFIPQNILAAECAVTDCSLLGYTDSPCPGSGLKCPFGEGWYCGGGAAEDCIKLGYDKACTGAGESGSGETCNGKYQSCTCDSTYKYTCSGTGYSGGSGSACGGKYTQCTCTSGYEWKNGSCQKQALNGAQGDLYYCNGKVVGVKVSWMNFYIAMKDLGTLDWNNANSSCQNYSFCGSLQGTLPSTNQLVTMYNNKPSLNGLLSTNGGTKLTEGPYWSSTINSYGNPHNVDMSDGNVSGNYLTGHGHDYVRCILTSW